VVRYSHVGIEDWKRATEAATGIALVIGIVEALVLAAAAWAIGGLVGVALLSLALVLPGLLVQDAWRYAFFAAGSPLKAFVNDLIWAVAQLLFVGFVLITGRSEMKLFILAWGAAGTAAALLGCWQTGAHPRPSQARGWFATHSDLGPRFAAEFAIGAGYSQLMLFVIGILAGLQALGAINAARVLLGPFNILALGAVGFGVPEAARILGSRPERLARLIRFWSGGLSLLALFCGVAGWLLPGSVGTALLGATWPHARAVLPFTTIFVAAAGAIAGAQIGLRVLGASKEGLAARAAMAPVILIATAFGAEVSGAKGAAAGMAAANCIGALFYWRQFERSSSRFRAEAAAGQSLARPSRVADPSILP